MAGKTYRFRISNVGTALSFNFRIQNHQMVIVETEGSYTNQITLDSLDVHVGQSYSVLVTADQNEVDYYIVATLVLETLMVWGYYTIPIPLQMLAGLCQLGLIHSIWSFQWINLNPLGNVLFIYPGPKGSNKKKSVNSHQTKGQYFRYCFLSSYFKI